MVINHWNFEIKFNGGGQRRSLSSWQPRTRGDRAEPQSAWTKTGEELSSVFGDIAQQNSARGHAAAQHQQPRAMIDFAEIEDVKENVQPLRAGRNAKELSKQVRGLKDQPLTSTVSIFEEGCKEWEEKLAGYGGDDPLEVWDEYIKWAQQNATSDKLSEQVVKLLQRCTRAFQAAEQYKNDARYLRIWIKYIDTVNDPADVFQFLEANQIGTGLALFYTSWALVLELKKSMYAEAYQKLDQVPCGQHAPARNALAARTTASDPTGSLSSFPLYSRRG